LAGNTSVLGTAGQAGLARSLKTLSLLSRLALIPLAISLGDALVSAWRPGWFPRHIWAVLDAPVHATLALLVVSPLYTRPASQARMLTRLAGAALAPVLIDLDHFVAAGSLSLQAAISLPGGRPFTHSLVFALALGLLAFLISRDTVDGWLVFGALASHVLRDASTGGIPYLLWPFEFERLAIPACYAVQMGLFAACWLQANAPAPTAPARTSPRSCP
jgi:membrane-bound metal-dependent hydrolase YbcI (DUF457 family)